MSQRSNEVLPDGLPVAAEKNDIDFARRLACAIEIQTRSQVGKAEAGPARPGGEVVRDLIEVLGHE